MTRLRRILRNLSYFRAANVAVVLGVAVATAVLTGALMVGDSVRGSLRALALQRLGPVDHAMVSPRFFEESLANRMRRKLPADKCKIAPAILVRGGAGNGDGPERTAGVQIAAVAPPTAGEPAWVPVAPGAAVVNGELAGTLKLAKDGSITYTVASASPMPRDAALSRRGSADVTAGGRNTVSLVETAPGFASLFNLEGSQRVPRNLWLNLGDLQTAVKQRARANALLVSGNVPPDDVTRALRASVTLDDYGLSWGTVAGADGDRVLNSRSTFIDPPALDAARAVAAEMKIPLREVSVYLINEVTVAGSDRTIHYAAAAGLSQMPGTPLADNEIAINAWTAERLGGAKAGDTLRLTFYTRPPGSAELRATQSEPLKIVAVIPMSGLGVDRTLTPVYEGLTDKKSIRNWDPPEGLHFDKSQVTPEDEKYWTDFQTAPKLFVNLATARKLWGGASYGDVTSVRVPAGSAEAFAAKLRDRIDPASMGLVFQPIRQKQLEAASGSTDFAMLFVGFSFFLIAAAALLVAMLMRLGIEQRARQLGLLAAVGFGPKQLRTLALAEGMSLALIGGVIGLAGAVGYTALMVAGLRTRWRGAVGTTAMHLYVEPQTLVIGLVASLAVAFVAILWGVWRVGRTPEARLLAGGWNDPTAGAKSRGRRWAGRLGVLGLLAGVALLVSGGVLKKSAQETFLTGGALLLTSCLLLLSAMLRVRRRGVARAASSLEQLGMRNAARHTARSVLSAGLIAFAAFTLITVAAFKQGEPRDTDDRASGAGGYRLILHADVPLSGDLATTAGRDLLALSEPNADVWRRVNVASMRTWAGQDVSCLNLTRPDSPTILAVPSTAAWKDRFAFNGKIHDAPNPWTLLDEPAGDPNTIPVIADNETAKYILKLGLGDTLEKPIIDQRGVPRKLKLVATLKHSIFQSEMLMSEANFLRLFPEQSGYGTVLIEASGADAPQVQRTLATDLEPYAVTVDTTAARLAAYAQVANTYLSTFQTLGSLGLMLGAIGLAVVLLRGLVERRSELALLTAIGFQPAARVRLVLAENAFLLVLGLLIGAGCALLGILPTLKTSARSLNLPALGATLAAVLLVGLLGLSVAVWVGQRKISVADLRAE